MFCDTAAPFSVKEAIFAKIFSFLSSEWHKNNWIFYVFINSASFLFFSFHPDPDQCLPLYFCCITGRNNLHCLIVVITLNSKAQKVSINLRASSQENADAESQNTGVDYLFYNCFTAGKKKMETTQLTREKVLAWKIMHIIFFFFCLVRKKRNVGEKTTVSFAKKAVICELLDGMSISSLLADKCVKWRMNKVYFGNREKLDYRMQVNKLERPIQQCLIIGEQLLPLLWSHTFPWVFV